MECVECMECMERTKISYVVFGKNIIIKKIENIPGYRHDGLNWEEWQLYSKDFPYYCPGDSGSIKIVTKKGETYIQPGNVFTRKEFGRLINVMRVAWQRLTEIRCKLNGPTRTIEI